MEFAHKKIEDACSAGQPRDPLVHDWSSNLTTAAIERYFLPSELPPESARVIPIYDRTVCLSIESKAQGTAVILRDQWLLTCSHVISELRNNVASLKEIKVRTPFSEFNLGGSSVEINDEELDFAIIKCPELKAASVIPVALDASLYLSDRCYLIGNPICATSGRPDPGKNPGQLVSIGYIEGASETHLKIYGPTINPGYSGGPIISRDGSLLGIVSEQYGFGGRGPSIAAILNRILTA